MIGRAFRIAPETAAPDYTDTDQIAEYALAYVGEFEARGYLTDSAAGTFRPADPITRAELINILSNMVDTLVKETTTVTENVSGSLLISAADGATLKGIKIGGDLILAPGVTKDVTLVDCVIQGNIRNYGTDVYKRQALYLGRSRDRRGYHEGLLHSAGPDGPHRPVSGRSAGYH